MSNNNKIKYVQQGDVLFFAEEIPDTSKMELLADGIVALGEATGHKHKLHGSSFELFEEPTTKTKYLRLVEPTMLRHEEHNPIKLNPGTYRIGIVREYDHFLEESRQVVD